MRIWKVRLFAVLALTIVLVSEASAQKLAAPEGFGVGGMVGFVSFSEEIDSRDPGIGFEGTVRYTLSYGIQVVGGVSYSIVDVEAADNNSQVLGFFLDPRLVLRMGMTGVAPFIGARVAYVDQSLDTDAGDASAEGILIAGIVGLLFPLSPQLALETTLFFGAANLGDPEIDGTTIPDSEISGATGSLKVGLVLSFPR